MSANPNAFATLADPKRRQILDAVREGPATVSSLVELLGISQPGVSKHLKVLREANLVRVRADGQKRWYELNAAPLSEIDAWIEPYRRLWAARFTQLETQLRNSAKERRRNKR